MKTTVLARSLLAASLLACSLATAATYSRTETITYYDNTAKWVLGQTASVTCTAAVPASTSCDGNDVMSQTSFSSTTALPLTTSAFGKLQSTMSYNADGTLATVKDGNNHTTTFSSWKRGIPQAITYADGTSQAAVVDNNGWLTSVTSELGAKTCYGYDAMGRLARITYPSETTYGACDATTWTPTTQAFVQVNASEYGIPAGHWRQTVTTGNATKITYYDGLWRPQLVREYDAANVAGTQRFSKTAYDAAGRVSFQSYPSTASAPTTGVWTDYDALGRVTSTSQDSELGLLITTTEYLDVFKTRTTSPRFQGTSTSTTTTYLTYDQPSTDWPLTITSPEGATTTITRDVFGKPTTLTRGDTP